MSDRGFTLFKACLVVFFLAGCASSSKPVPPKVADSSRTAPEKIESKQPKVGTKDRPIRLEGSVVRETGDELVEEAVYDPIQLFFLARDAGRRRNYERAIKLYERLLTDFPESRYVADARFNI